MVEDVLKGTHLVTTRVSYGFYVPVEPDGNFVLRNLPPGSYCLSYVGPFLMTGSLEGLTRANIDIPLDPAARPHVVLKSAAPEGD